MGLIWVLFGWSIPLWIIIKPVMEHSCRRELFPWFHTFLPKFDHLYTRGTSRILIYCHGGSRESIGLFDLRDVCPEASVGACSKVLPCCTSARSDHPTGQSFEGQVCLSREAILSILTLGTVMACMMFVWDYILTFGMEVDLIWKSKWSFMKGLYLFQRYLPFTDIIWLVVTGQSDHYVVSYLVLIFLLSFFL